MALIRPEQGVQVEGSNELSLHQQILGELGDIKESQTFMRVMLLGGVYREVPHEGMLPLVHEKMKLQAAQLELAEKRIKILEDDKRDRDAALRATRWLAAGLATIGSIAGGFIERVVFKH